MPRRQGTVLTLRVNDVRLTLVERVLLLTNAHTPLLWLDYITQLPAPPRGSTTSSCQWKWAPWSGDGSSLCSFSLPSSADQVQGVQRRTLRFYRMAVPVQRNSLVPWITLWSWSHLLTHIRLWHEQKVNLYCVRLWDLGIICYNSRLIPGWLSSFAFHLLWIWFVFNHQTSKLYLIFQTRTTLTPMTLLAIKFTWKSSRQWIW